jgi:hypothetical protein
LQTLHQDPLNANSANRRWMSRGHRRLRLGLTEAVFSLLQIPLLAIFRFIIQIVALS